MNAPNVLLVTTDHWPASLLGSAGHPAIQTPTLDELARSGTRFTNAYSECPVCIPARRTLMTGTSPRAHGDRVFKDTGLMPDLPTLAQTFRDAGYQAYAAGKLHVYPQRNRIGFDDVTLDEEGRTQYGVVDDYEIELGRRGYAGQQFSHGMSNNEYAFAPWHLPDDLHPTTWVAHRMAETIRRRDPTRPGFWYLSFRHPHPPLTPLQHYLDLYEASEDAIGAPYTGAWSANDDSRPYAARVRGSAYGHLSGRETMLARRAFYAQCTHIDHQIRLVIGTLREEGLLDDTIILFTSDHGDMLGNHGVWAKRVFYEDSANVPMILVGRTGQSTGGDGRVAPGAVDDRIAGLQDVMPTLLGLCGIPVPGSVEGRSMVADPPRESLYGECNEDDLATRMIRSGDWKLIYYPTGNRTQLFNVANDPRELTDLADDPAHADVRADLTARLIAELHGDDEAWVSDDALVGTPDKQVDRKPNKGLTGQRGLHWPPPPRVDLEQSAHP